MGAARQPSYRAQSGRQVKHADWQPKPNPLRQPRHRRLGPSIPRSLLWGLRKQCPACGQGRLFRRWFKIADRCPRCGLKFERIEGHWIGAIGLNTVATFALILLLLSGALIVFIDTDVPRWSIALGLVVFAVSIPPLIDPFTRTFWTAIDVAMRPLEAFEVDWRVVDPEALVDMPPPGPDRTDGNTFGVETLTAPEPDSPDHDVMPDPNEDL